MNLLRTLQQPEAAATLRTSRRRFFAVGGAAALLAACDTNDDDDADVVLDFSSDFGVLNYAYALEQLEAAFYTQVVATPYGGMSAAETQIMSDIKAHEVIHRDFFKTALGSKAIPDLSVDFSAIDFTSRASVLGAAKAFEDLGVAAYNGAGKYIQSTDYLTIAGKIVSVEARHAAAIRDLLNPFSDDFADLASLTALGAVAANGLDAALKPQQVLSAASAYIQTGIAVRNT